MQMKMFLTRLGENSRMIVTGDPSQVDLPPGQTSGLAEAVKLLDGVEGIGHVAFTAEDVIRHELVARIVEAYDRARRARETRMTPAPRAARGRAVDRHPGAIAAVERPSRAPTRPCATAIAAAARCRRTPPARSRAC